MMNVQGKTTCFACFMKIYFEFRNITQKLSPSMIFVHEFTRFQKLDYEYHKSYNSFFTVMRTPVYQKTRKKNAYLGRGKARDKLGTMFLNVFHKTSLRRDRSLK